MAPGDVFRNGNFSVNMGLTFLTGLATFGALTFLPLYQQTVQGASPTVSGLMLTPMMIGVTITSIVAGQVTRRTGRYKIFPVLGGAIMGLGMYLLTGLDVSTTRPTSEIYYVVLDLGIGFLTKNWAPRPRSTTAGRPICTSAAFASSKLIRTDG